MSFRTARSEFSGVAAFTVLEAVVALAVVVIALAAIGKLMAASTAAVHALADHVALAETARAIESMLPARDAIAGNSSGARAGYRWRIDTMPFAVPGFDPGLPSPWVPETVSITARSPQGRVFQIMTVQLKRRPGG